MNNDFARLQAAWADLDRRVSTQEHTLRQQTHETGIGRLRRRLRPLVFGQGAQILLGIALALLGGSVAARASGELVAGSAIAIQTYGIACIVWACVTLVLLARLDYCQPVIALQTRMVRLQQTHMVGSIVLGLAWWVLWIPLMVTLSGAAGGDYFAHIGPALDMMLGACALGLVATVIIGAWAWQRPGGRVVMRKTLLGNGLHEAGEELAALGSAPRS